MSDNEIEAMAAQLEAAARVEDAKFRLEAEWRENNSIDHCLIANRAAFLLLSALLLRGSVAREKVVWASPAFENEAAEPFFEKLERREDLAPPEPIAPQSRGHDILGLLGCALFCLVVGGIFIAGIMAIFEWI